jgi:hypothetical protein
VAHLYVNCIVFVKSGRRARVLEGGLLMVCCIPKKEISKHAKRVLPPFVISTLALIQIIIYSLNGAG